MKLLLKPKQIDWEIDNSGTYYISINTFIEYRIFKFDNNQWHVHYLNKFKVFKTQTDCKNFAISHYQDMLLKYFDVIGFYD